MFYDLVYHKKIQPFSLEFVVRAFELYKKIMLSSKTSGLTDLLVQLKFLYILLK